MEIIQLSRDETGRQRMLIASGLPPSFLNHLAEYGITLTCAFNVAGISISLQARRELYYPSRLASRLLEGGTARSDLFVK
jgi:hypothetical protein